MKRTPGTLVLVLALTASLHALTGCGPGTSAASSDPFSPAAVDALAGMNVSTVRRWTDFYGTVPMTITEQVVQTADGSWNDSLLSLNGKNETELTTADEIKAFKDLRRLLEGGRGRYTVTGRDFRIRDWNAFDANYDWNLISSTQFVAGRPVYLADVWPTDPTRPRYTVWVDQATLLTLKCHELLPTGELASEMEVLKVDFNPDLSGVVLKPEPQHLTVDPSQFASLVGFQTFNVAYVPAGFQFVSAKLATVQGQSQPVLTQSFSDGVIEMFFVQYAELVPTQLPAGVAPDAPVSVHSNYWGAMARTDFVLSGTQLHVHAKLTKDELMNVVESITPNP